MRRLRGLCRRARYSQQARFLHLALLVIRRDRRPMVDRIGFPTVRHPEILARELPGRDEEWLAALGARLWPEDEYAEMLQRDPPEGPRCS
jgi:hypothetical protein